MRNKSMWNKKRTALITAVAMAFSTVIAQAAGSEKQQQLDAAKESIQQLTNQKEQAQELLDQIQAQKVDLNTYIEEVDARMT